MLRQVALTFQILVAIALCGAPAVSEEDPLLSQALSQLRSFQERQALETLKAAQAAHVGEPAVLARIKLVTGLAHAQLSEEAAAADNFRQALVLDPAIRLPPNVSPLIAGWFEGVREDLHLPAPPALAGPDPKTVLAVAPQPAPPPAALGSPPRAKAGRWVVVGFGVAAGLAAGAGALCGAQAKALSQQARADRWIDEATVHQAQATSTARAANGLYIASAALGVGFGVALAMEF